MSMIQVNELKKSFGSEAALRGISFEVGKEKYSACWDQAGRGKRRLLKL